jgi:hypothetical protein
MRATALLVLVPLMGCADGDGSSGRAAPAPDPLTLSRTGDPNDALACPPDRCRATPDLPAPTFAVPAAGLLAAWREVIADAPRTTMLDQTGSPELIRAEQRSRWWGFVDDITIEVLPLDDGRSTFAAYSRSRIGTYDFGVNHARLERWINDLDTVIH